MNYSVDWDGPGEVDRVQGLIDGASKPLKRLGERLADLLDADHWNNIEPLLLEIAAENERLQGVKRRTLAIADERAIEAVKARAENERLRGEIDLLRAALDCYSDEQARLRAALKPFCTADWYATGHGTFDGKIEGAVLDEAKSVLGMVPVNQQGQSEGK